MLIDTQPAATGAIVYDIDPIHSSVHFSLRHMMVSTARGEFTKVSGTAIYDPANPEASQIEVVIAADSIDTHDSQRDAHLKNADFLNAAQYPEIRFRSTRVAQCARRKLEILGNLTIAGVTREARLIAEQPAAEVKDGDGSLRAGSSASTTIDRRDFGLVWNQTLEAGGVLLGNDVKITIEVELVRRHSGPPARS